MPTPKKGPRLGSGPDHQRLMLSTLASQLFIHQGINTTEAKAKMLRPYAEKLITKAKKGDLAARREVLKDSAPGFDPQAALAAYDDDDDSFVEDEQY